MDLLPLMKLAALAAAPGGKKPPGMDLGMMLMMFVPVVGLLWWMSRSQKKREQKRKDMIAAIKKGDKVVTIGGIHGEITRLNEREAVLMVDKSKGVELRLSRSAIAGPAAPKGSGEGAEGEQDRLSVEGGGKS
jgi:preprotein translocase subunit YajC